MIMMMIGQKSEYAAEPRERKQTRWRQLESLLSPLRGVASDLGVGVTWSRAPSVAPWRFEREHYNSRHAPLINTAQGGSDWSRAFSNRTSALLIWSLRVEPFHSVFLC